MEMLPIIIKQGIMKKSSAITSINSKTSFVKKILKKFLRSQSSKAVKRENAIRNGNMFSANYELIAWSSILIPIDGRLDITFNATHPEAISRVSIPIQSGFLVTCTKEG